jgi:hypothetical protein
MPYSINWIEKKIMNGEKIRVLKEAVLAFTWRDREKSTKITWSG